MIITQLRATQPDADRAPQGWRRSLGQILVRVDTDDGLSGYGVGGGGAAGIHVVETALREVLIGARADDVEGLWDAMYRHTAAYGYKGIAMMAQSGVDLALWDLRGKRANKPLVEVLGGANKAVPSYRTGGRNGLEEALAQGYKAVKFGIGAMDAHAELDAIADLFGDIRTVTGPDIQVMCDASMGWDVEGALRAAERLVAFDLTWLEEPLLPEDFDGYERLMRESPIPIASGEHEYTARGFEALMQRGLHAIYQPDVCWCGGLTELVKIYALAKRYNVSVCPHRGGEVWALHAIVALDPDPLAESGRPWMTWVRDQPRVTDGNIAPNDGPGFGVSFHDELWAI